MQPLNFDEVLETLAKEDPRYAKEAYYFLREGLDYTQKTVTKKNKNQVRHISGQELLLGLKDYGLLQYGPMTLTLLNEWGVKRCEDFGEMVFNLLDKGLLSKTENDRREDFHGGYNFEEAFQAPFRPSKLKMPTPTRVASESLERKEE